MTTKASNAFRRQWELKTHNDDPNKMILVFQLLLQKKNNKVLKSNYVTFHIFWNKMLSYS